MCTYIDPCGKWGYLFSDSNYLILNSLFEHEKIQELSEVRPVFLPEYIADF